MAIYQDSTVEKPKTNPARDRKKKRVQRNERDKARHKKPRLAVNEAFPIAAHLPQVDEIIEPSFLDEYESTPIVMPTTPSPSFTGR